MTRAEGPSVRARTSAAGDSAPVAYRTTDGLPVSVRFSRSYTPDPEVAQSYVDFRLDQDIVGDK